MSNIYKPGSGGGGGGITAVDGGTNITVNTVGTVATVNLKDPILQQNDTASAPSYSFASSTNSGWYFDSGFGGPALSANGTEVAATESGVFFLFQNLQLDSQIVLRTNPITSGNVDDGRDTYLGVTAITAATPITLPPFSNPGTLMMIKDETGTAGTTPIVINTSDGSLIDGQTTAIISANYGSLSVIFRASNWWIV